MTDRIEALEAENARLRADDRADGWLPISSAPRDGSRFLAKGGGLEEVDICSYNARVGCWNCGDATLDDTDHEPDGYNRPAQWMPLAAIESIAAERADLIRRLEEAAKSEAKEAERWRKGAPTIAAHFDNRAALLREAARALADKQEG